MVTGNEILNYQGNAALGAEGGSAVIGNLDELNRTLDNVWRENARWNAVKLQQKIKDRDDMHDLMSKQQVDVPVLDNDQKALVAKRDEMWGIYEEHPDIQNHPEAYARIKRLQADFVQMKANAQVRYTTVADKRKQYAENPDARFRETMGASIAADINSDINHIPEPYYKPQDYDLDKILAKPVVQKTPMGGFTGKDGLEYASTRVYTPIREFFDPYSPVNFIEGENKNLPDQARVFYEWAQKSPLAGQEWLQRMNDKMEEVNRLESQKPNDKGSPYYLPPVAQKGPDGQLHLVANDLEFARAMSVLTKYENRVVSEESKTRQDMRKIQAQTRQADAAAGASKAAAGLSNARANEIRFLQASKKAKLDAETLAALMTGKKTEYELQLEKDTVAKPVADVTNLFTRLGQSGQFKPAATALIGTGDKIDLPSWANQVGATPESEIMQIPVTDATARQILTDMAENEDGKKITVKPRRMYAIREKGDPDNIRIVGVDAQGKVIKGADRNQSYNELIRNNANYNGKVSTETIGKLTPYVDAVNATMNGTRSGSQVKGMKISEYDEVLELDGGMYYRKGQQYFDANGNELKQ